jgi:hypothetical protein
MAPVGEHVFDWNLGVVFWVKILVPVPRLSYEGVR